MIYNADQIKKWDSQKEVDGKWVLARPVRYVTIFRLIKMVWGVITGKYDVLEWTHQ